MSDWTAKITLACDADYRNKLLDKRQQTGSVKANHELQVYHLLLYLSLSDVQEVYQMNGGQANDHGANGCRDEIS